MSVLVSQTLILSPGGLDLNAPIIGWHNVVTFYNIAADFEEGDFPAVHMANPSTIHRWKSTNLGVQYVTVTTPSDVMMDYVGIARHNLGSGNIQISIEADIGGVWTEIYAPHVPAKDAPLLYRFPETLADGIRLKLDPLGAIGPEISVVYVGKLTVLQRRIYVGHTPLPYGRDTEFTNNVAESGDFQGRIELSRRLTTSVNIQNLTPAWYRENLDPLFQYPDEGGGRSYPFFFAWRPLTYSGEVGYAWLTNNPKPTNQRSNGMMQVSLSMGGLVL